MVDDYPPVKINMIKNTYTMYGRTEASAHTYIININIYSKISNPANLAIKRLCPTLSKLISTL